MKLEIGDNLVHILQLVTLAVLCVLLTIFAHVDTTTLLIGFFGVGGTLGGIHLTNMSTKNTQDALTASSAQGGSHG